MRIAYDEQAFQIQRYGGVSRYIGHLANAVVAGGDQAAVFAPVHCNEYLRSFARVPVYGAYLPYPRGAVRPVQWLNRRLSPAMIASWKPDVVHETYYSRRPIAPPGTPTVVTVHDMITELYPDTHKNAAQYIDVKKAAIRRATRIICVSECTRRDLMRFVDVPKERTTVIHHGCTLAYDQQQVPVESLAHGRPYILYVGNRAGYKNFTALLKALGSSRWLLNRLDLVLCGGPPLSAAELRDAAALGVSDAQLRRQECSDSALASLYRNAVALVYPSAYEGFGLPVIEAMASACPVICSDGGSLPEVAGDAAETFAANSWEDMRAAIERVVDSTSRQQDLRRAGLQRAALFSWERCAAQTRQVYEESSKVSKDATLRRD